jgi:hypothetical protein
VTHSKRQVVEELARARLGCDLQALVAVRRAFGVSWRLIAGEVTSLLNVEVSHEALRQWYGSGCSLTHGCNCSAAAVAAVPTTTPSPASCGPLGSHQLGAGTAATGTAGNHGEG